jgi:hypothetical protein
MTTTTDIKKALRQEFPKTSFRVSTKRGQTTIEWDLTELGSPVTVKAVEAIARQFLPFEVPGNSSKKVYPLTLRPNISSERTKWAREWVLKDYQDVEWDNFNSFRYSRLETGVKEIHYYANVSYRDGYENGITSPLLDEYGYEPAAKRFYYLKQEEAAKSTENGCIQLIQL